MYQRIVPIYIYKWQYIYLNEITTKITMVDFYKTVAITILYSRTIETGNPGISQWSRKTENYQHFFGYDKL